MSTTPTYTANVASNHLDGGGLLQSILNAAGGVTNTIANLTTPQQQQQASQIAAAIVQQPQRQPIVVAPNQPMPQTQASPVLLAQNQTTEDQGAYGDLIQQRSDATPRLPAQMLRDNGYTPMVPRADEMPPAAPTRQPEPVMETGNTILNPDGQPVALDAYQYMPPQQAQPAGMLTQRGPYAPMQQGYATPPEVMQVRQWQAQNRLMGQAGLANPLPPPRMLPPPVKEGYGTPRNWQERFGNGLARLRGNMDPRGYGAQQDANLRAAYQYRQAENEMRQRAWQEQQAMQAKLYHDMVSGTNVLTQNEFNMAGQQSKAQKDPAEKFLDPKEIRDSQKFILESTKKGSMDRARMILDAKNSSQGVWQWDHLFDMDSLITQQKEETIRGKDVTSDGKEQKQQFDEKANPLKLRGLDAKATIAEAAAGQAQQQQQLKTDILGSTRKISAIRAEIADKTKDATIQKALQGELAGEQKAAIKNLDALNKNNNAILGEYDRYQGMIQGAIGKKAKAAAQAQAEAQFGKASPIDLSKLEGRKAVVDIAKTVLGEDATQEEAASFMQKYQGEIAARSQLVPKRIVEAQMFRQYGYESQRRTIAGGAEPLARKPESIGNVPISSGKPRDGQVPGTRQQSWGPASYIPGAHSGDVKPAVTVTYPKVDPGKISNAIGEANMAAGMIQPGNIDLTKRPIVHNGDGTISTVRSMSFNDGQQEVLVPTVSDDGRIMADGEAIDYYYRTGKHLGKFRTPDQANAFAEQLHKDQEQMYAAPAGPMRKVSRVGVNTKTGEQVPVVKISYPK